LVIQIFNTFQIYINKIKISLFFTLYQLISINLILTYLNLFYFLNTINKKISLLFIKKNNYKKLIIFIATLEKNIEICNLTKPKQQLCF
jgi:hypothetical protein